MGFRTTLRFGSFRWHSTVTDTTTALGTDVISGVETLRFNDGDLTVTTAWDGDVTLTGTDGVDDVVTIVGAVVRRLKVLVERIRSRR